MAHKLPLGKIKDTALGTIRDPRSTVDRAVDQARGTVALGRTVAGRFTRTASDAVIARIPGRKREDGPTSAPEPTPPQAEAPEKTASQPKEPAAPPEQPEVTPADVAAMATKKSAPGKPAQPKAAAKKPVKKTAKKASTPSAKLPPKKPAAKKAPSKKAATTAPARAAAARAATGTTSRPQRPTTT